MIGRTVSHYRILEKVGQGGMGEVFLAEDTKLDRKVALKFLPAQFSADEEERKRFVHEAKAAAALSHSNIVTIYEIGEHEGQVFIAMEHVEGRTLKEFISVNRPPSTVDRSPITPHPLPITQVIKIAVQIASGLAAAHAKGIVHRDLKPANIMLTDEGTVKIVDFGLAKLKGLTRLTKSGTTLGTVAYMSPEQALGKEVDQRSDIWSLGVILYEMLTNKLPFPGEYEQAMLYAVINEEPESISKIRNDIPDELRRILRKALVKEPGKRYQKADAFISELNILVKESSKEESQIERVERRIIGLPRKYFYIGVATLAAAIAVLNFDRVASLFRGPPPAPTLRSIAVLPLANYSGDPGQEFFSEGLTDALIAGLAQIKSIKVISRTSVMQYKDTRKPLPQIARELDVEGIVEGSVMRAGDRVRITAQLIDASQDRHIWASNYEREMSDVLALQAEVVRAIAREVRAQLTLDEENRLRTSRRLNPRSYEAFLKGRFFWNQTLPSSVEKSIDFFQEAIRLDPSNAAAYAGLVEAYAVLNQLAGMPVAEFQAKSREAAHKALEVDETLGESHLAMGIVKDWADWDWEGAEREFKRAIELSPSSTNAHLWYAQLLQLLDRHEEANTHFKRARELDPLNPYIACSAMMGLYCLGRYDEALAGFKALLEMYPNYWPNHWNMGSIYSVKGMFAEAIAEYRQALAISDEPLECLPELALAYGKAGQRHKAQKVLDQLREEAKKRYVRPTLFIGVYIGLDETDKALDSMEKAYEEHDHFLSVIFIDPLYQLLRTSPRFQDLRRRMGLAGDKSPGEVP